jgi:CheY-like chemotaxis protein
MRKSLVVVLTLVSVLSFSTAALACGESVFRAGKGLHYRAFTAPIPGTVLVYARNDSDRAVADSLQQAGHDVHVVASAEELAAQLKSKSFDVIVAPFAMRETVSATTSQSESHAALIPVLDKSSSDLRIAKAEFDDVVMSDDDIRKYLKAIHHSLKTHGA